MAFYTGKNNRCNFCYTDPELVYSLRLARYRRAKRAQRLREREAHETYLKRKKYFTAYRRAHQEQYNTHSRIAMANKYKRDGLGLYHPELLKTPYKPLQ